MEIGLNKTGSAALDYAGRGFPVFPLHSPADGRCSCGNPSCKRVGKHPRTQHGFQDAVSDPAQIKRWWGAFPKSNIGIQTGQASGFWVLDIDGPDGEASLKNLIAQHDALPETPTVKTGNGRHLYFRFPTDITLKGSAGKIALGLDVRAEGNYIIAPPSRHASGTEYEWVNDPSIPFADAPPWLIDLAIDEKRGTGSDKGPDCTNVLKGVPEGKRDATLFKYACQLFSRGLKQSEVDALVRAAARNCEPSFPDDEARKCVLSASKYRQENELPIGKFFRPMPWVWRILSEHRIISVNGDLLKWTPTDGYYKPLGTDAFTRLCVRLGGDEMRVRQIDEIRRLLIDETARPAHEVDSGDLMCIQGGVLDCDSGDLLPYDPDLLLTFRLPVNFDPQAKSPRYDDFLRRALPDPLQRDLLHEMFSYCLLRDTRFQTAFLLLDNGQGSTGKSTTGEILQRLLGPGRYRNLPLNELSDRFKSAELYRVLANISSETDVKEFLKDSMIKTLISGEEITVERKYRDPHSLKPYAKLIVTANRFPNTYDGGDAFLRRWIILMYGHSFPKPGQKGNIPCFAQSLSQEELDGVFLYTLRGLARLKQNNRFTLPASSLEAVERYRRAVNPVLDFAEKCLVRNPSGPGTPLKRIHEAYKSWCGDEGCHPLSYRKFRQAIQGAVKTEAVQSKHENQLILPGFHLRPEHEWRHV